MNKGKHRCRYLPLILSSGIVISRCLQCVGLVFADRAIFFEEKLKSACHRRSLWRWCLNVNSETCVAHCLGCRSAQATDSYTLLVLVEVREVFEQRVDTFRAEEEEHVVVEWFVRTEIVADCAIHDRLCVVDFALVECSEA